MWRAQGSRAAISTRGGVGKIGLLSNHGWQDLEEEGGSTPSLTGDAPVGKERRGQTDITKRVALEVQPHLKMQTSITHGRLGQEDLEIGLTSIC